VRSCHRPKPPLVGILSERDIVRALATQGVDALDAKVADLMTREVRVCDEETTMASLMGLMTEHHIRHVPVVKEKSLVGLVSIGDVVKAVSMNWNSTRRNYWTTCRRVKTYFAAARRSSARANASRAIWCAVSSA